MLILLVIPVEAMGLAWTTQFQMEQAYNGGVWAPYTESALTNTTKSGLTTTHYTTGTPAAGIGSGIDFVTQTSAAGNTEIGIVLKSVSTDVTGATEDFDFLVLNQAGGAAAAERFRVTSTGAAIAVGSYTGTTANLTASSNQVIFDSDNGTSTGTLTWTPTTSNRTITLPDASGTVLISGGAYLALNAGGTNASLTADDGAIVYSDATKLALLAATATANQVILSGSNTAPTFSTATYPATAAINTIMYASGANVLGAITAGASGVLVTSAGNVPSIATDIPTAVTIGGQYNYRVAGTDVALADGGTGIDSSGVTDGQLLIGNTSGNVFALAALTGTANQVTVTNGASAVTLSTPQDIETTSDVEFNRVNATDLYWEDEFLVADHANWATDVTTGSVAIQNAVNGTNRLTTGGTTTNEESLDWGDVTPFLSTQQPVLEVRFQLEQTAAIEVIIGFTESVAVGSDDFLEFIYDASVDGDWRLTASTGGTPTSDTGAAADTSMHIFRLEWVSDTEVEWFIDGASQGNIATNVPTAAMQPTMKILTESGNARYFDIDYFKIWQDRT